MNLLHVVDVLCLVLVLAFFSVKLVRAGDNDKKDN
jgi:hypothetical protein